MGLFAGYTQQKFNSSKTKPVKKSLFAGYTQEKYKTEPIVKPTEKALEVKNVATSIKSPGFNQQNLNVNPTLDGASMQKMFDNVQKTLANRPKSYYGNTADWEYIKPESVNLPNYKVIDYAKNNKIKNPNDNKIKLSDKISGFFDDASVGIKSIKPKTIYQVKSEEQIFPSKEIISNKPIQPVKYTAIGESSKGYYVRDWDGSLLFISKKDVSDKLPSQQQYKEATAKYNKYSATQEDRMSEGTKIVNRLGEAAAGGAGVNASTRTDTGNKILNGAEDLLGNAMGFMYGPSPYGQSQGSIMNTVSDAVKSKLPSVVAKNMVTRTLTEAATNAAAAVPSTALQHVANGEKLKDVAVNTAKESLGMGALAGAGHVLGEIISKIKLGKPLTPEETKIAESESKTNPNFKAKYEKVNAAKTNTTKQIGAQISDNGKVIRPNEDKVSENGAQDVKIVKPKMDAKSKAYVDNYSKTLPKTPEKLQNHVDNLSQKKVDLDSKITEMKNSKADPLEIKKAESGMHEINLQLFAASNKLAKMKKFIFNKTGSVSATNMYVDESPLNIKKLGDDKSTAKDIRQEVSGKMNYQVIKGNQLADKMKKIAPNEQEAITFFNEANGDKATLQDWYNHIGYSKLKEKMPNSNITYGEAIKKAMNLSPEGEQAAKIMKQYYTEQGNFSKKMGTISDIRDNYNNRIYMPEKKTDFIKSGTAKNGVNVYSSHSKARVYDTIYDAIVNGKKPATLKANELLSIHNEEMARANINRQLADALQTMGIGGYVKSGKIPEGFAKIDSLKKQYTFNVKDENFKSPFNEIVPDNAKFRNVDVNKIKDKNIKNVLQDSQYEIEKASENLKTKSVTAHEEFVVPEGIAKGLQAITERVGKMGKIQKYQGIVKTIDLSFSAFHHITMLAQTLYQSKGGLELIKNIPEIMKMIKEPEYRAGLEQDFVRNTGMTSKVESNQDILRSLVKDDSVLGKLRNAPVIKQIGLIADKNSEFLFGKMQRWLKVMDYNNKISAYIGKHPNLTDGALISAKRSIAKEVNAAYGGLNWKALGMTPSVLRTMRLALLAPDWTYSNIELFKLAGSKGPGGAAARSHLATAMIGGSILTEGLSYILTGHYTDKNAKGHEFEVEIAPGVYFSFFRGGIGDILKATSNVLESGLGGVPRFAQAKLSPFARTLVGMLANKDITGASIIDAKDNLISGTGHELEHIFSSAAPVPFGVSNIKRYLEGGQATPAGTVAMATGTARYQKDKNKTGSVFDNPTKTYQDNLIHKIEVFVAGSKKDKTEQKLMSKIDKTSKDQTAKNKLMKEEIGKIISSGNKVSLSAMKKKYGASDELINSTVTSVVNQLEENNYSPLMQKFMSMSSENRTKFYNSLSKKEQDIIMEEFNKIKPKK